MRLQFNESSSNFVLSKTLLEAMGRRHRALRSAREGEAGEDDLAEIVMNSFLDTHR